MTDLTFSTRHHKTNFRSNIIYMPYKYFQHSRVRKDFQTDIFLANCSLATHEQHGIKKGLKANRVFLKSGF